jgi:hypothetical protein
MEARAKVTIKSSEKRLQFYATSADYLAWTGSDLTEDHPIKANEVWCGWPQSRHDQRQVNVYIDASDPDNVIPFDVIKDTFEKLFFSHTPFNIEIEYVYGPNKAFISQYSFDGWVIECQLSSMNPGIRREHTGSSYREPEASISDYYPVKLHVALYAVLDDDRRRPIEYS